MASRAVLVSLHDVVKDYRGLRPLRVRRLELCQGSSVALLGFDPPAAEVLTNLITGATIPDEGDVSLFGSSTRSIATAEQWLRELDRFGLLSDRVVLLDRFTVEQNLAVPFSLALEALDDSVREQVRNLADEVGLAPVLHEAVGGLGADQKLRLRLGKALALNPPVLLAEHPNAAIAAGALPAFSADLARIIARRGQAALIMTADRAFAREVADEVLTLQPATGELRGRRRWEWFL